MPVPNRIDYVRRLPIAAPIPEVVATPSAMARRIVPTAGDQDGGQHAGRDEQPRRDQLHRELVGPVGHNRGQNRPDRPPHGRQDTRQTRGGVNKSHPHAPPRPPPGVAQHDFVA